MASSEGGAHRTGYSMSAVAQPVPGVRPAISFFLQAAQFVFVAGKFHRSSSRSNGPDARAASPIH